MAISSRKATGGTGFRSLVNPSAAFCICWAAAVIWASGLFGSGVDSPQAQTPPARVIARGTVVQRDMTTSEFGDRFE